MEFVQDHLLSWIVFLPLGAGLVAIALNVLLSSLGLAGIPRRLCGLLGLVASTLSFALCVQLVVQFDATSIDHQFVEHARWLPELGVNYFVGVDGINLLLLLLTTFLVPVVILATWNEVHDGNLGYVFAILSFETCVLGGFASLNLVQFYAFWELASLPLFFLVGIWGAERGERSATRFALSAGLGSLLLWIAILLLASLQFEQFGRLDFDLVSLEPGGVALLDTTVPLMDPAGPGQSAFNWRTQVWLFAVFALAFAIRIPLVPFHRGLAHLQLAAPTAAAALVLGVTVKLGIYGFIRYAIPLAPAGALEFTPGLIVLALVGVVGGALVAMSQDDLRKCLTLIALSQLALMTLGVFTFNAQGLSGSVLQMLGHGLSAVALVLLVGMLRERRHTGLISESGGLATRMPVFVACFGLWVMSMLGVPLSSGFVGEFLILLGTFRVHPAAAAAALLGILLVFAFMLRLIGRVLFGNEARSENRSLVDLGLREKVVMGILILPVLGIGVYPEPLLRRIEPSVLNWLRTVDERSAGTSERRQGQRSTEGPREAMRLAGGRP
ncbi:NADH-quinone oxidoreductase subunit M [Myxococcota bacterium]|nr:NADH-quinone oxidoreductase subunit M [Myxococcota bacterium]